MVLTLKQKLTGAGLILVLLLAFSGYRLMQAAPQSDVGYVDMQMIVNAYLLPEIQTPLKADTDKLQAEFDAKAKGMDDKAKQDLFSQYQDKLNSEKTDLINAQWPKIDDTVAQVAKNEGLKLVLDKQGVVYGGVDLTKEVLLKLGVKVSDAGSAPASSGNAGQTQTSTDAKAGTSGK